MGLLTSLYSKHVEAGAKLVDFSGWDMPINYGSQIEEHNTVREHAGVFDVSHMTVVDITGSDALVFLQFLLANDVGKLDEPGRALYSAMLNDDGGVIDDLIVYRLKSGFRLVVNCATREKDLTWITQQAKPFDILVKEQNRLAILAVHGPESIDKVCSVLNGAQSEQVAELKNFRGIELENDWFIARTGYTGEKGLELIIPEDQAAALWDQLLAQGVKPIGLGARDTLRLEAGMNLYGHDMDESISPLAANMEQTIAWQPDDREFIGRAAISRHKAEQQQGRLPILTGLVLESRGVLRDGQKVITEHGDGVITSGSYSPTLKHSIALARIPKRCLECQVELRGKLTPVRVVPPNFVRFGKKIFE